MRQISLAFVIAAAWLDAHAQTSLPPCPSDTSVTWTNCFGTISADGATYMGEFLGDQFHGRGTYTFANGAKYVGEYQDGKRNGQGTYTFANGAKYVGRYRDGEQNGQGALISAEGYTFVEGIWQDERQISVGGIRWYRASENDTVIFFVQPQSIRQEGAFRRAWLMAAYSAPNLELKVLSLRQLMKLDCVDERFQYLTTTAHSGSFGSGTILHSADESNWQYAPPGTVIHGVMKYVCDYKLTPIK